MVKGTTAWGRLKVRSSIAAFQTGRETNESRKRERERKRMVLGEKRQKFKRRKLQLSEVWGMCGCVCERCRLFLETEYRMTFLSVQTTIVL